MFDDYLARWGLVPDGDPIVTHSSRLLPVRHGCVSAFLKVAVHPEEKGSHPALLWWDGDGAVRVLAYDYDALLLERAIGVSSLAEMARNGREDEASRVICGVAAKLHRPRGALPDGLTPLRRWFRELEPAAAKHGGILVKAAATARELLAEPREVSVLHGDLHHDNVLDGGKRGWLAIDPKRLLGERGFDFANIFENPDYATATAPGRLARQSYVVAKAAGLERPRLLKWILAYAGLSAAWWLGDGNESEAKLPLTVAEIAAAELAA